MENALTDLVKQGPTVAVLIIVLYKLFGLYTSQQKEYREIIDELKEVVRDNTTAMNNLTHYGGDSNMPLRAKRHTGVSLE